MDKFDRIVWTIFLLIMIALIFVFASRHAAIYRVDETLYSNQYFRIAATQDPIDWHHGKFRGIDREWLLQSLADTTLFGRYEIPAQEDSLFYNKISGDTVYFKYIRKDRFFKINRR